MKTLFHLLFTLLILAPSVLSQPEIKDYINDYSGIISEPEFTQINNILRDLHTSGRAEYSIVIIDSLEGQDIESYSYELAEGVLGDKEKDNGLLLLVALNDRQYRFEVGYGLEGELPDVLMFAIGRNYIEPNFREENYGKGILEATEAIQSVLVEGETSEVHSLARIEERRKKIMLFIFFVFTIIIIFAIIFSFASSAKNYKGKRKHSDNEVFTAAWILSQMMKGGKGGGDFGSGGFGGFSGGSFGGGGFSGKW